MKTKTKPLNVLSLFNGMSGGRMALDTLGIPLGVYYSSEIDKYTNKVTELLYPDVIQLGDITQWREWDIDLKSIDLLLAGFPCQAWSMAGKMKGDKDPRGALVHDLLAIWLEIKKKNPNVKFLFENVRMKKEFSDYVNNLFGIEPIVINSGLVSAQNRVRCYWTNIPNVTQPVDRGITWGDVRERGVNRSYYTPKGLRWILNHSERTGKRLAVWADDMKAQMCEASDYKNYSSQRFYGICDVPNDTQVLEYLRSEVDVKAIDIPSTHPCKVPNADCFLRYKTVRESARLQTIPENHINTLLNSGVSNTQLFKMIGNGWTHNVIVHLFKEL